MSDNEARVLLQYQSARRTALHYIERMARAMLRKHKDLGEFVMGMGTWTFNYKDRSKGRIAWNVKHIDNSKLAKFIEEWDDALKLTGTPMRFTADGPIVTEW